MNEELKTELHEQGDKARNALFRKKAAAKSLELFDANSRIAILAKYAPKEPTLDTAKAYVLKAKGREKLVAEAIATEADYEGVETHTKCLLALASLTCAEVAAMSRIAGQ